MTFGNENKVFGTFGVQMDMGGNERSLELGDPSTAVYQSARGIYFLVAKLLIIPQKIQQLSVLLPYLRLKGHDHIHGQLSRTSMNTIR